MPPLDAVPVPMMNPQDAMRLLRTAFPELTHIFSDPAAEPDLYQSYGELARETLKRKTDNVFLGRVATFMNDLIRSREYVLRDLGPEMLEEMGVDLELLRT